MFGKAANAAPSQIVRGDLVNVGRKINRPTFPHVRSALRFFGAALSILLILLLQSDARSQTLPERSLLEDYSVRHWDHLKGLPESVVTGLSFDHAGFLWLSTTSQLVRFDGVDFTVWEREDWPGKPPALLNHLASDKAGNLWLSGVNGVLRLGPSGSKAWPSFDDANTPEETIATGFGPNGEVYLRTRNHESEGPSSPLRLNGERWSRETSPETNRDATWSRIDPDHWRLAAFPSPPSPPASSSGEHAVFLTDPDGNAGVFTPDASYVFTGGDWLPMRNPHGGAARPFPESFFYHQKTLWTGGAEGVFAHSPTHVYRITGREGNAPVDNRCLMVDGSGNIWAGGGTGLFRFQKKIAAHLPPPEPETRFSAVTTTRSGRVLAATESGGVYDISNGTAFEVAHIEGSISSVVEGTDNSLWIGTRGNHLLHVEDDSVESRATSNNARRTSRVVLSLHRDTKNQLWAGCVDGLLKLLPDGTLSATAGIPAIFDRLDPVSCIAESADGTLWFGFQRAGLGILTPDGTASFLTEADGLPSTSILALHLDRQNRLWISTLKGIAVWEDGTLRRLGQIPGLGNTPALQILSDQRNLWAGTREGLLRIRFTDLLVSGPAPQSRGVLRITATSGLASDECLGGTGQLSSLMPDGRPAFITSSGISSIRADAPEDSQPAKPRIEALLTESSSTLPPSPLEGVSGEHALPSRTRWIEVLFTAPDFGHLDETVFRHRLEGLHSEWSLPTTNRRASFQNLPAGNYRFEVQAGTPSGDWHPESASLAIRIAPRFTQSVLFLAAVGSAAIVAIALLIRIIIRIRLARLLAGERLINDERQRISRDLHDEIGAKLTRIGLLSSLCKTGPQERRNDRLLEMESSVARVQQAFQETLWAVNPRHDSASGLAHFACKYLEDFLEGAPVRPVTEIGQGLENLHLTPTFRRESLLIVKQAISNALEHANPKFITLSFGIANGSLTITIRDDGAGFSPDSAARKQSGLGEGIRSMKERCSALGGLFSLSSHPGQGTQITLTWKLPLKS
jgi:signal transduction histidine kinase/streptogramin lyase